MLTGCVRPISQTPAEALSPTIPATTTATAADTQPPSSATLSPVDEPTPTVITPPTQPSIAAGANEFPLATGNSWVYQADLYAEDQKASYFVTDTVVEMQMQGGRVAARMDRTVQALLNDKTSTPTNLIDPPVAESFWLVLDGSKMYRVNGSSVNWDNVSGAALEYVFPFPENSCWVVDGAQRPMFPNPDLSVSGCRRAEGSHAMSVRAGKFTGCTTITTPYNSGSTLDEFCPGVGIVSRKYDHTGSRFGYQWELVGYLIQNSGK